MSVRTPNPVSIEPEAELSSYRVFRTPEGSEHFAGMNSVTGTGRVSSFIVHWDPESRIGVTGSGRRYRLVGEPGSDGVAEQLWASWSARNGVGPSEDVSDEYRDPVSPTVH